MSIKFGTEKMETIVKAIFFKHRLAVQSDTVKILVPYNRDGDYPQCYKVVVSNLIYKIRLNIEGRPDAVKIERAVINELNNNNYTTIPNVFAFDTIEFCGTSIQYLITNYIYGTSVDKIINELTDNTTIDNIITGLIRKLRMLHGIKNNMWCDFSNLQNCCSGYEFFIQKTTQRALLLEKHYSQFHGRLSAILENLEKNKSIIEPDGSTLIHFDIKAANILYDEKTQCVELIDWEMARYVDIDFEWSKLFFTTSFYYCDQKIFYNKIVKPVLMHFGIDDVKLSSMKFMLYLFYHIIAVIHYDTVERKESEPRCLEYLNDIINTVMKNGEVYGQCVGNHTVP